jgi:hypothetical protein
LQYHHHPHHGFSTYPFAWSWSSCIRLPRNKTHHGLFSMHTLSPANFFLIVFFGPSNPQWSSFLCTSPFFMTYNMLDCLHFSRCGLPHIDNSTHSWASLCGWPYIL